MRKIYISAGGTGGHIHAALSVGEKMSEDYEVHYYTGQRYLDYQLFKDRHNVTHIKARPLRVKNPLRLLINLLMNAISFVSILFHYIKNKPLCVIGAGGYVCGPTLFAAYLVKIPVFLIEQNSVIGLTNKLLSKIATNIFLNFENTKGLDLKYKKKCIVSGNPIRQTITFSSVYPDKKEISILVFGGSLGAVQVNQSIEKLLEFKFKRPIKILHQVGKNNLTEHSAQIGNIRYDQVEYIDDMNLAYDNAHIIVARSGASTISELEVIRKPSILIPYPAAVDNHQKYNADNLKDKDWFYVSIIDHTQKIDDITKDIFNEIEKIIEEDLFSRSNEIKKDAVAIIVKRINECLE